MTDTDDTTRRRRTRTDRTLAAHRDSTRKRKPWMGTASAHGAHPTAGPEKAGLEKAVAGPDGVMRCPWAVPRKMKPGASPTAAQKTAFEYHDHEWGRPDHSERYLVEQLILGGFQSGLSWRAIVSKRENFRRDFDDFDPRKVADYTADDVDRLMQDPGIIRNRRKIEAAIANARMILDLQRDFGSLHEYVWHWTFGHRLFEPITTTTDTLSDIMSADMKKRGSKYLGSVTVFSYLQDCGPICSHVPGCTVFEKFPPKKGDIIGRGYPVGTLRMDGDIHFL